MKKMNNKGFSLVELIVVIAIMAVLVGVLAPQFIKYVENSRRATDVSSAESIRSAILADIADQKSPFKGSTVTTPTDITTGTLPTSIADTPTIKATSNNGSAFKATWSPEKGTCDVYDQSGAYILTDPNGGAAYKNQDTAPAIGTGSGDQKKTVVS